MNGSFSWCLQIFSQSSSASSVYHAELETTWSCQYSGNGLYFKHLSDFWRQTSVSFYDYDFPSNGFIQRPGYCQLEDWKLMILGKCSMSQGIHRQVGLLQLLTLVLCILIPSWFYARQWMAILLQCLHSFMLIEFLFPLDSDFLAFQTVLVRVIFCTFPSTEQYVTLNSLLLNKKSNHLFFFSVW